MSHCKDFFGCNPFITAILSAKLEVIRVLLGSPNVAKDIVNTPHPDGSYPLHISVTMGVLERHENFALECVRLMLDNDADALVTDDYDRTPLFLASAYGLDNIITMLFEAESGTDAAITMLDVFGYTPLHVAALNGHQSCVELILKYLLSIGNLDTQTKRGDTALHLGMALSFQTNAHT